MHGSMNIEIAAMHVAFAGAMLVCTLLTEFRVLKGPAR